MVLSLAASLAGCQAANRVEDDAAMRPAPVPTEGLVVPAGGIQRRSATRVTGLDERAVERLLGQPALIRREAPAQVWQYRAAACVLDLFLYEERAGARVIYAEARTMAAQPVPPEPCVNQLLAARQRLSSS